ncbi:TPA: hypothetical protein N0F65_004820 [Lagenidium giganteum]|uniref:HTH CENPB-type domain-containing protein n=1 Tax=Lagenidium giganteum TaxID=4803 RepID=A0AAV2Z8P9_9STRA|nr:TPA: hypothetical protein N0F65_004820 [Lagenidium giganteum]
MDKDLLLEAAQTFPINSTEEWTQHSVDNGKKLIDSVNARWVRTFCERHDVIIRHARGKLAVSEEKKTSIERSIAFHLGELKRKFDSGELDDDTPLNMDETHFIINMDNKTTLDFRGRSRIKYHDVVSDPPGHHQVIYMDNVEGHKALEKIENPDLQDEMDAVIARKNDKEKLRRGNEKMFSNKPTKAGEWSGKLTQPGKTYFLQLAVPACRIISGMRDDTGLSVVRKSMIRCGLRKNITGVWEEKQLTPHLQELMKKHREYFEGKEPEAVV